MGWVNGFRQAGEKSFLALQKLHNGESVPLPLSTVFNVNSFSEDVPTPGGPASKGTDEVVQASVQADAGSGPASVSVSDSSHVPPRDWQADEEPVALHPDEIGKASGTLEEKQYVDRGSCCC